MKLMYFLLLKKCNTFEVGLIFIAVFISILVLYDENVNSVYGTHMQVSVKVDKVDNIHSGYIFYCFDPVFPLGCDRVTFMV